MYAGTSSNPNFSSRCLTGTTTTRTVVPCTYAPTKWRNGPFTMTSTRCYGDEPIPCSRTKHKGPRQDLEQKLAAYAAVQSVQDLQFHRKKPFHILGVHGTSDIRNGNGETL